SITQAPAHLDLAGTTAALAAGTLTVTLTVKNNTAKFFPNPKVEVTSTTNATFSASDGTADTYPFRTLGPNWFAPGATITQTLVFTAVTSPALIHLTFAGHASMVTTRGGRGQGAVGMIDIGAGLPLAQLTLTAPGP